MKWRWYGAPLQRCIKEVLVESNNCSYVGEFVNDLEKKLEEDLGGFAIPHCSDNISKWIRMDTERKIARSGHVKKLY